MLRWRRNWNTITSWRKNSSLFKANTRTLSNVSARRRFNWNVCKNNWSRVHVDANDWKRKKYRWENNLALITYICPFDRSASLVAQEIGIYHLSFLVPSSAWSISSLCSLTNAPWPSISSLLIVSSSQKSTNNPMISHRTWRTSLRDTKTNFIRPNLGCE